MSGDSFVCVDDIEKFALSALPKAARDFYQGGADDELTLKDNREAFKRWRLRPRMLRDLTKRDLSTTVLGEKISFPIAIAPTSTHRMAHPDGEIATARAAASSQTLMVVSTGSTCSLEEIAESAPEGLRWFQMYVLRDRLKVEHLVRRVEKAGYKAIVVTVDYAAKKRRRDLRNGFELPSHLRFANFESDGSTSNSSYAGLIDQFEKGLTWNDITWLRSITYLPIVLKGLLTGEDGNLAVQAGADAIIVSNHGGRLLDGVLATIDVLPEVVRAVRGRCEVYIDGGITMGTDALKALALGARAVFVGRPIIWGLTWKGEDGVKRVLEMLKSELDSAMSLSGCSSIEGIQPSLVVRQDAYCRL